MKTEVMRKRLWLGIGAFFFTVSAAVAAPGMKVPSLASTTCFACHGLAGVSEVPMFPDLAGQGAPYLIKQIHDFKDHKRADPLAQSIMWEQADAIPAGKIQALADYFASQNAAPGAPEAPLKVAAGRKLYMGGFAANHLPACMACHGSSARGLPPLFPRLAGQHMTYVIAQLQAFKAHQRTNDPLGMMETIAAKLSNKQMTEIAAYLRTL